MKKKISIVLCAVMTAFLATACTASRQVAYDQDTLLDATEVLIQYCAGADETVREQWESLSDYELEYQLMQSGLPFAPEGFLGALEAWPAAVEECGAYEGHGDFEITADGDEIHVTTMGEFAQRKAEIEVVYDADSRLDSLSVSAEYSMGEILEKAGLNTILGMGTVFVVLIFISIIISLMKYIPALGTVFQKKSKDVSEKKEEELTEAEASGGEDGMDQELTDDAELVAVIAAAVAAAEGTSADGFVVRSIRRRPSNKWKA
ncbi:OadG family transporter subunit [uncultured Merdimonas sp.]|uniref:OadG family transporter subunit n=1 Tax=uncultured Merdimonas sp. TaxID=2023269 RepID=UPI00320810E4